MKHYFALLLCILFTAPAQAGMMVWGVGYVMSVQEPKGWVAISDVNQSDSIVMGLHQRGYSWDASPAVMYARIMLNQSSLKRAVSHYVSEFQKECSAFEIIKIDSHTQKIICNDSALPSYRIIRFMNVNKMKVIWTLSTRSIDNLSEFTPVFEEVVRSAVLEKRLVQWGDVNMNIRP